MARTLAMQQTGAITSGSCSHGEHRSSAERPRTLRIDLRQRLLNARRPHGNFQPKSGSTTWLAVYPNASPTLLDDPTHRGKTQARTDLFRLRREERLEDSTP